MSTDVLGYLQSKGLELKKAGGDEIHTHCPFCGEDPSKRGRLYVNINPNADIPGLFECKKCDAHGAFPTLQRHFGDKPEKGDREDDVSLLKREILARAALFYHELLIEDIQHIDVLRWLTGPERKLTIETIEAHHIGYAPGGMALYKHLRDEGYKTNDILNTGLVAEYNGKLGDSLGHPGPMVTIPYKVVGNVVGLRGRAWPYDGNGLKYKTPPGNAVRLFNSDGTWGQDEIIICEGEFDALVLEQLGFNNVVALPGANVYQDAWDAYFTDAKRIFTVFDNDAAGAKGEAKLLAKFGPKIRSVVLSENGKCDPTSWVGPTNGAEQFRALLVAVAKSGLLVSVDEAQEEHASVQGLEGIKFGLELLDVVIAPGLLPAQVMVVLAKAGCMAGDTEIRVNRAGKGFAIPIKDMYDRWCGRKYAWDLSTPTYVQRHENGVVRLGRVEEVWSSGVKPVYEVTTDTGRRVKATAEHPFETPDGWRKLSELSEGSPVLVNAGRSVAGRAPKINYAKRLKVLTPVEHAELHAREGTNQNVLEQIGTETVVGIRFVGEEPTYDISVADDPHNFLADGFVVHNTGKTLFLLNTFQRMSMVPGQENMKFLFVSLEQTRGEWFERARRIHRFYNLDGDDSECLDYWRDRMMIVDKNRLNEEEFIQVLDDYEERMGQLPDLVAIDYLGYWAQTFKGDRYERVSDAVMSLKAVAKEKRISIITPHQVSRVAKYGQEPDTDAARDAGVVEETADFLLTLWSPDALLGANEKSGIVNMRVGKSRHGGRGTLMSLQFAPLTLALVPAGDALQHLAHDEVGYEQRQYPWQDAIWRHRTGIKTEVRR